MVKKNPWKTATYVLIGILVLGGIVGLISFGGNNSLSESNSCPQSENCKTLYSYLTQPDIVSSFTYSQGQYGFINYNTVNSKEPSITSSDDFCFITNIDLDNRKVSYQCWKDTKS